MRGWAGLGEGGGDEGDEVVDADARADRLDGDAAEVLPGTGLLLDDFAARGAALDGTHGAGLVADLECGEADAAALPDPGTRAARVGRGEDAGAEDEQHRREQRTLRNRQTHNRAPTRNRVVVWMASSRRRRRGGGRRRWRRALSPRGGRGGGDRRGGGHVG